MGKRMMVHGLWITPLVAAILLSPINFANAEEVYLHCTSNVGAQDFRVDLERSAVLVITPIEFMRGPWKATITADLISFTGHHGDRYQINRQTGNWSGYFPFGANAAWKNEYGKCARVEKPVF
jgi:hypothetical protein